MMIAKYVIGSIAILFAILMMLVVGKTCPALFVIVPVVIFFIIKAVKTPGPMKGLPDDWQDDGILDGPDHAGSCAYSCHWGMSISEEEDKIFGGEG